MDGVVFGCKINHPIKTDRSEEIKVLSEEQCLSKRKTEAF